MQFPIEDLPLQSPLTSNINNSLDIYSKLQQAMAAPEQMKMQRAIQQAALQKQQMDNQYYPQDIQSQIALKNAQALALQNKAPSYQSGIGQQVADRMQLIKQYGPNSPQVQMFDKNMDIVNDKMQAMAGYQRGLTDSLPTRYATPQARAQLMSFAQNKLGLPTEKAIQVAANPSRYFPMGAEGNLDFSQFQPNGIQPQAPPQGMMPGMGQLPPAQMGGASPNPAAGMTINPQMAQQAIQANPQIGQQLGAQSQGQPPQQPMPNGSPISAALSQATNQLTPDEKARAGQQGLETQSYMDTKTIPVQQQNAIYAANRARVYANSLIKEMPNITQYFNPAGKLRLTKDQLSSVMSGKAPEGLQDLANFKSDLENYKLEAATMLRVPADQQGRGDFGKAFDLNSWYTNPQLAQQTLMHIMQNVTNAEKLNAQPVEQARQQSNIPLPSIGQALSAQGSGNNGAAPAQMSIPNFNSKSEFQTWFKSKTPAEQAAIKQQMSNQ